MGFSLQPRGQVLDEFPGLLQLDALALPPLAGQVDNLDPPNGSDVTCWIVDASEAFTLTGIKNGRAQKVLVLLNISAFDGTISALTTSDSDAQFQTSGTIPAGQATLLVYNASLAKWVVLSGGIGSGSATFTTLTISTLLNVAGRYRRSGVFNMALAAGANNNVAITGNVSRIRATAAGAANITGFTPSTGAPSDGDEYSFTNIDGTDEITLTHDSGASTYPLACPGGVDRVVIPGETVSLWYDGTSAVFRVQ